MAQFRDIENVKFFVVNSETTAAFANNVFSETYPNLNFDNTSPVNLTTLSNNYEIKPPVFLGENTETATITSAGLVTSTESGFFNTCVLGDYLFAEDGGLDSLIMLGKIVNIISNTQVQLDGVPPNITYTGLAANNTDRNIYRLPKNSPGLPFKASDSFYMVIQNPDYDDDDNAGKHNAIPLINYLQPTAIADVFGYGGTVTGNNFLNMTYFAFVYLSNINDATHGLTNSQISYGSNSVPCTISPISTLSQQISEPVSPLSQSDIPYWSVYLVNPYGVGVSILPKNTSYKVEMSNNIPVKLIETGEIPTP
jgi:hypothetical protein